METRRLTHEGGLKNGLIYPVEPLPQEWKDGQEVWVEEAMDQGPESVQQWAQELNALCASADPEDDARLQAALQAIREEAKITVLTTDGDFRALPDVSTEDWLS